MTNQVGGVVSGKYIRIYRELALFSYGKRTAFVLMRGKCWATYLNISTTTRILLMYIRITAISTYTVAGIFSLRESLGRE